MLASDTDLVSRPVMVVVSVLVVAAAVAAVWFGTDLVRPRGAAAESTAASRQATGEVTTPGGGQSTALAGATSPVAGAMDTTLVLAGGDVRLSYPAGFGLATTLEQLLVSSPIPPCDEGFDYCIYLDSGEFEGTNFSSAGVRVAQRDDLPNEAACILAQPQGHVDLVPVIAGASDFATTMYQDVGEGAAGHFSNGSLGRLYYGSTCYEFESRVAQAQFSNFPPGTVREFDADALAATVGRLMGVLDGVTLPDGRAGLWARKVRTEPVDEAQYPEAATAVENAAFRPTVNEPAAGAHVSSPLRVTGEAPGSWFFEASFGYRLVVADGTVLASGATTALGEWMTEGPVPFEADVEFEVTTETNAMLVLAKDNPSGLVENDATYEVPLLLLP